MAYKKPNKLQRNEEFLKSIGISKNDEPYQEAIIEKKKKFLIVCEGKNTEPEYFKKFHVPTNHVIIKRGCNTKIKLVKYAIKLKKLPENEDREIWCVYDYDFKPDEALTQPKDFDNSIKMAHANGMNVAWSNDAFELWFVLHYQDYESSNHRSYLNKILKKEWGLKSFSKEAKTQEFCEGHYDRLGGTKSVSQSQAIKRARALHNNYGTKKDYHKHCSCTTVYKLVEELNKNLKE
jgi:hypothetical protein